MVFEIIIATSLIFFIIMSLVLEYHWRRYVTRSRVLSVMRILYYSASIVFLFIMAVAMFQTI